MPASEDFYRNQKKLHLVFLISSLGLFAATIWMLAADHIKAWKNYQRDFNTVNREVISEEIREKERLINQAKLDDVTRRLETAQEKLDDQARLKEQTQAELSQLQPELLSRERAAAFAKADQAQLMSQFDLVTKQLGVTTDPVRKQRLERDLERTKKGLASKDHELARGIAAVDETKAKIAEREKVIEEIDKEVKEIGREREELLASLTTLQTALKATDYGLAETIRALPVIDGFESPVKIKQVVLEDLGLDYNFKHVTRYDRCMTCHLGIDKPGFSTDHGIKQPFCEHPRLDLYVGAKSPHPVDKFGCTVCHQGQGSATSFDWASHAPADSKQRKAWEEEYGWFFNHFHELPMLPKRFVESSCLKCHHDPYEIPQAKKLLLGYATVRTMGCFGCHEINGYKDDGTSIGPNLRLAMSNDSEEARRRAERKIGPNLQRIAQKLDRDFVAKWIRSPVAFSPMTRMPQFYDQLDTGFYESRGPDGEFDFSPPAGAGGAESVKARTHDLSALATVEIHAITAYLMDQSQAYANDPKTPPIPVIDAAGDAGRGKDLFSTKGCIACHNHKDHPEQKPRGFGPSLSEVAVKFKTPEQKQWLAAWIKNPAFFNATTFMPSLQLSDQESADLAAYLVSVPGAWAQPVTLPEVDLAALEDLVMGLERKGKSYTAAKATVDAMSTEQRLSYLGQKTIARLGCFGCHDIPGFENAKGIGVPLADWGKKDPHKLAFENVVEYVSKHLEELPERERANHFYTKNDHYLWAMGHHQREGFLMQKLREPRSYDYKKIKRWEDRTRMPRFNLSDEERDAVATFVLGLVAEDINRKYVFTPSVARRAEIRGRNLLDKYNCTACHVVQPGEYRFTASESDAEAIVELAKKDFAADHSFPGHAAWDVPAGKLNAGRDMVLFGLPDGAEDPDSAEDPENLKAFVRLWEATSVSGQVIPSGLKIAVPQVQMTPRNVTPPQGGRFAEQLVGYLLSKSPDAANPAERDKAWAKVPPPLIREGEKVQTPWLYRFLRDPVSIRPAVVLRMPKFNYLGTDVESLANYFAAADGTPFPYIEVPERQSEYLEAKNKAHPNYLEDAFRLITNKDLCIKCHPIGGYKPTGKPEELGPPLARAPERLRPDWMLRWIANPKRLLPYTGMPVNFPTDKEQFQDIFKGSPLDQVTGARDALINYNALVDEMMTREQASATAAINKGDQP